MWPIIYFAPPTQILICTIISDSVVLKGIKKAALDHSIKLARTTKELLPTNERAVSERESESTDHPWISRKVGHICVLCV